MFHSFCSQPIGNRSNHPAALAPAQDQQQREASSGGEFGGAGAEIDEDDDFFGTGEGGGLGAAFDKAFNSSTKRAVPVPDAEVRVTPVQLRLAID